MFNSFVKWYVDHRNDIAVMAMCSVILMGLRVLYIMEKDRYDRRKGKK